MKKGIGPVLSLPQRAMLLSAKERNDWTARGNKATMRALVRMGLAKWTQGYGWKYGELIELTPEGMLVRKLWAAFRDRIITG